MGEMTIKKHIFNTYKDNFIVFLRNGNEEIAILNSTC